MRPDQERFLEQLYREQFYRLREVARGILADEQDAEEAVQDAFHKAVRLIDDVMASPSPAGWMRLAVKNSALNLLTHREMGRRLMDSLEAWGDRVGTEDPELRAAELFRACRQILGEETFDLVYRAVVEGEPYEQLARERGLGIWACRKRVQRGLDRIRRALDENFFHPPVQNCPAEQLYRLEGGEAYEWTDGGAP